MQITLEGRNIYDIASFYKEVNRVFMQHENWKIGESLDALNDLLYGGFGIAQGSKTVELVWRDIEISAAALGHDATRSYYLEKLKPGSQFNKKYFQEKLHDLELGMGHTYFDIIMEVLSEHSNIILTIK